MSICRPLKTEGKNTCETLSQINYFALGNVKWRKGAMLIGWAVFTVCGLSGGAKCNVMTTLCLSAFEPCPCPVVGSGVICEVASAVSNRVAAWQRKEFCNYVHLSCPTPPAYGVRSNNPVERGGCCDPILGFQGAGGGRIRRCPTNLQGSQQASERACSLKLKNHPETTRLAWSSLSLVPVSA